MWFIVFCQIYCFILKTKNTGSSEYACVNMLFGEIGNFVRKSQIVIETCWIWNAPCRLGRFVGWFVLGIRRLNEVSSSCHEINLNKAAFGKLPTVRLGRQQGLGLAALPQYLAGQQRTVFEYFSFACFVCKQFTDGDVPFRFVLSMIWRASLACADIDTKFGPQLIFTISTYGNSNELDWNAKVVTYDVCLVLSEVHWFPYDSASRPSSEYAYRDLPRWFSRLAQWALTSMWAILISQALARI